MGRTRAILTTSPITALEFIQFVQKLGGFIVDNDNEQGRLSDTDKHVWLFYESEPLRDYEPEELTLLKEKLGALPVISIIL